MLPAAHICEQFVWLVSARLSALVSLLLLLESEPGRSVAACLMSAAVLCVEARQSQPRGSMPRCKLTCSLPAPHLSDPCCSEYSASIHQSHRTNGTTSAGRAKAFYPAAFPQSNLKSCNRESTDSCVSKHTSTAVGAKQALTSLEGETTAGKGWRCHPMQDHPLYVHLCVQILPSSGAGRTTHS